MDDEPMDMRLPADVDDQLNRLLAEWALQVRLSLQEEEELYDRIFVIADDLGYDWWRQLAGGFSFQTLNVFPSFVFGNVIKL
ncbi:hypothetical protein [Paenibacillus alkalitolerans]|uniref:hypothetical protein n=1 Tax=Paenibacillus alkalitolerans TaxID=2799335 RepID=UPI0018F5A393|nr:hypothetical protein [Paenibacillus alkalitolerans]